MNRFASTRSLKRASQPSAGRAQWSVGSMDDDGIRYGLTTHALSARTMTIAPAIVNTQSRATRTPRGRPGKSRPSGSSHRTCSRRQASIFAWSPESRIGHLPAPELGRPRVVRVLEAAAELLREALELAGALGEGAGQPPGDRVEQHHRRQIAVREDVRADRDRVGREMLDDALVEALEPGGEERQLVRGRELFDDLLRQRASFRRERDHPLRPRIAVHGLERGRDDVDAQHHAGAAAVGLVVDLAGAERRRLAVVEEPQVELGPEHRADRPLLGEPGEGVRDECEDVDSHCESAKPGAITIRPPSTSTFRTQASTSGSDRPESSSRTSFAG